MSLGSIFVGLAIAVIVIAYIARPFRAASSATSRTDKLIEAWVRAAPVATAVVDDTAPDTDVASPAPVPPAPVVIPAPVVVPQAAPRPVSSSEAVNFCPQCGRRVTAEYRFCPGCGALLPHEEGAA